jgi:hypothetical protein
MRSLFRYVIIIVLLEQLFACQNNKYPFEENSVVDTIIHPTVFYPEQFTEEGRLYYYAKVFGILKYFLSKKAPQDVNVLFLSHYHDIKKSADKKSFNRTIQNIISAIHPELEWEKQKNTSSVDWVNDTTYFDNKTAQYIAAVESLFRERKRKSCSVMQNCLGIVEIIPAKDISHVDDVFPEEALRLWSMADYWNYINYFWVYKNLMDNNWDSVLYVNIPNFVNAQNRREYLFSIFKFIAYTNDTHVSFRRTEDTSIAGNYVPNVRLTKIDSLFVVKRYRTNRTLISADTILHIGDIIHSVNGIDLCTYYDSLQYYFAVSNSQAKVRKVAPYMLASFIDTNEVVISRNGIRDTLKMLFCHYNDYNNYEYDGYDSMKNDETVQNINGIGYLHVFKLFSTNMQKNIQALQQYENIIIDMRGYPNSQVFFALTNKILPFGTSFFNSTHSDIVDIGKIRLTKGYTIGFRNKFKNKNIVILVDETTQSHAEFLVMALQQNHNVKVIGMPTAGADGNVLYFTFAGNIQTTLTGIGIVYPDGRQTQRCGIKIDYLVNPTIEDYINTQDPILDYAIQYFKE